MGGAASAPLRCAGLRSATAASEICAWWESAGRHRQIGWSMAFYLRGKISVGTNDPSPKEAMEMSRDIKYIGMDVHQEAIVIAANRPAVAGPGATSQRPGAGSSDGDSSASGTGAIKDIVDQHGAGTDEVLLGNGCAAAVRAI